MSNEKCRNPFKRCSRTDIEVTIWLKGKEYPICKKCWKDYGENGTLGDKEW